MRVLIDILHTPHINFFKHLVPILEAKNYTVDIICLDRGKNIVIAKAEFPKNTIYKIGKHRGNIFSIIFEANLFRFFQVVFFLFKRKYDIGLSVSGFVSGAALKLFGTPNFQFYDDPENKKNLFLQLKTANKVFYPPFKKLPGKVQKFRSLKEWSYLSPEYFIPDESVLIKYGLKKKDYVFVRDVSVKNSNYIKQSNTTITSISKHFSDKYKVLLSLEDKSKAGHFPENWVILKEPENNIHSLIYYSKVVLSSGDSMVREGAVLGVPSIYCGIRKTRKQCLNPSCQYLPTELDSTAYK